MKTNPEKWKELVADIVDRTEDIVIVKELAGPHQTCLPHHQHHPQLWFLLLRRQQLFLCFCVSSVITRQPLNRVWKCTQGWSKSSEIQISFKFGIMFTTFDQLLCGAYSNLNFDIFISPGWTNNVFKVWGKIIFSVLSWWTLGWARCWRLLRLPEFNQGAGQDAGLAAEGEGGSQVDEEGAEHDVRRGREDGPDQGAGQGG